MGTRSTIQFNVANDNGTSKTYVTIYRQFDGYTEGVGLELAEWLASKVMINGISKGQHRLGKYANGIGCLVAQYIRDFKREVGDLYITTEDSAESDFIDYHYEVVIADRYDLPEEGVPIDDITTIRVTCWSQVDEPIFVGSPTEFMRWVRECSEE